MRRLWRYFRWWLQGRPMIHYYGYNCGLCGKWVDHPFQVPEWDSAGRWWDTWGMCGRCANPEIYAKWDRMKNDVALCHKSDAKEAAE